MPELRLTNGAVAAIPNPSSGQVLYRDTGLRGFGVRVGIRSKTFFAEGQVNAKTRRITIGRVDLFSAEAARKKALALLAEMAEGTDPIVEERKQTAEGVTVAQAFDEFFAAKPHLAANTVAGYQRTRDLYLRAWRNRHLGDLDKQEVLRKHREISREHGGVSANNAMRHLRSVYNFTAATRDGLPPNPVDVMKQARAWHRERRRSTVIHRHRLPAWWEAVLAEPDVTRHILLVALFTGMRRGEVMQLRWENIDLIGRRLHLPHTKNGEPLELPLCDFLVELFTERQGLTGNSLWVFPGIGKTGHFVEIKKALRRVSKASGVTFTMHDLRRTFITIVESLDVPYYALKRMLNHGADGDVTGGYIVIDSERLRGPVEQVAERILELVGNGGRESSAAKKEA